MLGGCHLSAPWLEGLWSKINSRSSHISSYLYFVYGLLPYHVSRYCSRYCNCCFWCYALFQMSRTFQNIESFFKITGAFSKCRELFKMLKAFSKSWEHFQNFENFFRMLSSFSKCWENFQNVEPFFKILRTFSECWAPFQNVENPLRMLSSILETFNLFWNCFWYFFQKFSTVSRKIVRLLYSSNICFRALDTFSHV